MNTTLKKSLAAALALAFAGAVQASPLFITQWEVGVNTYFDELTIAPGTGIQAVGTPPRTLNWGSGTSGSSGLDITNPQVPEPDPLWPILTPVTTSISPNLLAPAPNVEITHRNRPITGASLDSVTIISELTLRPILPIELVSPTDPVSQTFRIQFLETPNNPSTGECADGTDRFTDPLNSEGCADIFVIDRDALNFPFKFASIVDDGAGNLSFSGTETTDYFLSFLEVTQGLNPLSPRACLAVTGSSEPCLGFRTAENAATTFQFGTIISTEPVSISVPEPGTLALLGLGLGALGLGLRRRRSPTEA